MNFQQRNKQTFLDVSDYIVTEHRLVLPSPKQSPLPQNQIPTPHNLPIMIEVDGLQLSPYFHINKPVDIQFYDFTLEGPDQQQQQNFQNEQQLEKIGEENQQLEESPQQSIQNQQNQQQISLFDATLSLAYFRDALKGLREMNVTEKLLKEFVFDYFTEQDKQKYQFQKLTLKQMRQVALFNLRYVGPISWLLRKKKVKNYLLKKKRRIWKKKISYVCRKKVADNRLRVKGKFVTNKQAFSMLGEEEIKEVKIQEQFIQK